MRGDLLIPPRTYQISMGLKKHLEGILPADIFPHIADHFEVIGDIAVLALPHRLDPYKKTIAETIVAHRKNIYTVLNKTTDIAGTHRTAQYEVLLGKTTITVHREFSFSYRLDVGRSFFSARMAYERKRVTDQVEPGERVYVPFAGVGPFAIPAAARGAEVCATEMNPDAFHWLSENIALNHVERNCHPRLGDALEMDKIHHRSFDRLIIPAPYGMDDALPALLPLLSEGGMAHFYTFRTREQIPGLIESYEKRGLTVTFSAACGNVAPGVSRWVFDLAYPI
jgi:tRNA (guanine37-N1)-methyltransferase